MNALEVTAELSLIERYHTSEQTKTVWPCVGAVHGDHFVPPLTMIQYEFFLFRWYFRVGFCGIFSIYIYWSNYDCTNVVASAIFFFSFYLYCVCICVYICETASDDVRWQHFKQPQIHTYTYAMTYSNILTAKHASSLFRVYALKRHTTCIYTITLHAFDDTHLVFVYFISLFSTNFAVFYFLHRFLLAESHDLNIAFAFKL